MNFYKEYIKEHYGLFIISFTLWLSAVFIGMYIAFSSDKALAEEIRQYIVSSVGGKHSFASVFKNGVITNFKYSLALIISSMSVVFLPAAAFLIAFKGFSAGFTSMFLIKLYGLSGLGTSLTAVVIPLVFSLPVLFMMFVLSLYTPISIFTSRRQISAEEKWKIQFSYIIKIFILFFLLCLINIFEALVSPWCFSAIT